ncbi:MAG: envelope stress response membrane protein PspB [Sphingopyxis sp.]
MEDTLVPIILFATLFIGLPWLILHHVTKWRTSASLPVEDERLLDDLYEFARRLEDRMHTVERIIAADNPDFRPAIRSERESDPRIGYTHERSK